MCRFVLLSSYADHEQSVFYPSLFYFVFCIHSGSSFHFPQLLYAWEYWLKWKHNQKSEFAAKNRHSKILIIFGVCPAVVLFLVWVVWSWFYYFFLGDYVWGFGYRHQAQTNLKYTNSKEISVYLLRLFDCLIASNL